MREPKEGLKIEHYEKGPLRPIAIVFRNFSTEYRYVIAEMYKYAYLDGNVRAPPNSLDRMIYVDLKASSGSNVLPDATKNEKGIVEPSVLVVYTLYGRPTGEGMIKQAYEQFIVMQVDPKDPESVDYKAFKILSNDTLINPVRSPALEDTILNRKKPTSSSPKKKTADGGPSLERKAGYDQRFYRLDRA